MLLQLACLLLFFSSWTALADPGNDFVQCLIQTSDNSTGISQVIYTPDNPLYNLILKFKTQNLVFGRPETPKPQAIITPYLESEIQTAIFCSKKHGLQMRIRSGGHDFEAVSYVSKAPFFVLDLFNFRSVSIDTRTRTAWVGAGATLGELYYSIHEANSSLFFPAGTCPTVAVGGHLSGGGYGQFTRKYGLAADNIIDARVIDANGRILDRKSMGEDFFWAIRGGGGASFGVILEYKLNLQLIRPKITTFTVTRTPEQNATELVYKWQYVGPHVPEDLSIFLQFSTIISNQTCKNSPRVTFQAFFVGNAETLLSLLEKYFPELGVLREDCKEINWLDNIATQYSLPVESTPKLLLSRISPNLNTMPYFKGKTDFVQKPIPKTGIREIFDLFSRRNPGDLFLQFTPFGGIMNKIPASSIPFPYRAGYLFLALQVSTWSSPNITAAQEGLNWIRELHEIIGKYVQKNPRGAYVNYRDLDLGTNNLEGSTSVEQARVWGTQYFKNNFDRLVRVKTMVDPQNYFTYQQSIPSYLENAKIASM